MNRVQAPRAPSSPPRPARPPRPAARHTAATAGSPASLPTAAATAPARDPAQHRARAERYGHRLDRIPSTAPHPPPATGGGDRIPATAPQAPVPVAAAPIQRMDRGKKNDRTPLLAQPSLQGVLIDERPEIAEEHHQAIATGTQEDASTGLSVVSGLGTAGSIGSRAADYLDTSYNQPNVVPGLGIATGALSAVGSTVDAATRIGQIATGTEQAGDKALLGLEATSSLGNATVSGASAATHASTLLGTSATVATHIAAPAAMVMGGADIIGGGVGAYRAAGRQKKLQAIERNSPTDDEPSHASPFERGVARFAGGSQQTKKMRGLATALKGGLALGGGLALLLGAGPIGWGLLGGAAAVAGGMALYKQYRKHKEGKKILQDANYRQGLESGDHIRIPTQRDLDQQKWTKRWNPFNTRESRTHDLVRAQIAQHLEAHVADPDRNELQADDAVNNPLGATVGLLGLRNKGSKRAKARDIARALGGG